MSVSRNIGHTHLEEMSLIWDFILNFDVDRLLYAINGKSLNESEIESITLDIIEQNTKLCRQKKHLFEFGKVFNKEFATDDNHFFDTSIKVSRKMRSGTKGAKDIFKKFCKVSRRKPGEEPPQAINVSLISTHNYIGDMFGLTSYPDCVLNLFKAMMEFYGNLDDCIGEAMRTLQEEKATKKDNKKMLALFQQAYEKSRKNQIHIIEAMDADPVLKNAVMNNETLASGDINPVLKHWKNSDDEEIFAAKFFHNCTPKDIGKITLHKVFIQTTDNKDLNRCMALLGCNEKKASQILEVIKHFDNILPEKCKRGKIPAMYLHVFMRWCGVGNAYSIFLRFFNLQYKAYGGKWEPIKETALSGVSTKSVKQYAEEYNTIKEEVEKKIYQMFPIEQS